MPLLNIESYVFINLFYLVLFCIRFCVDDIREKKTFDNGKTIAYKLKFIDSFKFMPTLLSSLVDNLSEIYSKECKRCKERKKIKSGCDFVGVKNNKLQNKSKECKNRQLIPINWLNKNFPGTYRFCNRDINKFILLLRKGVYTYEYMDS